MYSRKYKVIIALSFAVSVAIASIFLDSAQVLAQTATGSARPAVRTATSSARATPRPTPTPEPPADPSKPFSTSLETSYDVADSGMTTVTNTFTVTNNSPTTFLKEYGLQLHSTSIQNIVVKNNKETIDPQISTDSNTTSIKIAFPDEVVGQGKKRTFSISYQSADIAAIAGKVLEVHIPPFTSSEQYTSRKIVLNTPLKFGRATRITPEYTSVTFNGTSFVTTFDQPTQTSISAFFGSEQYYKMTLRYNLENESSSPGVAQIALPPDTQFQRMHFYSLEPSTSNIKIDEDGNWIATYTVPPQSQLPVYLTTGVKLLLDADPTVPVIKPTPQHVKGMKFWDTHSSLIKEKTQQFNTPESIYNHIVDSFSYSYAIAEQNVAPTRLGAETAFARPTDAVCQEFTDAFVTMSRAAGVPARRLTGYAYTQNSQLRPVALSDDVLHAWPEFFNAESNHWQQVDPTWENTTGGVDYFHQFDLSHIVFAINGASSTTPYPAGAYNLAVGESKDVEVEFADNFPSIKPELEVGFSPRQVGGVGLPGAYLLQITNKTAQAWYDIDTKIESSDSQVLIEYEGLPNRAILPYQTVVIPIQLSVKNWSVMQTVPLSIKITLPEHGTVYESNQDVSAGNKILAPFKDPNVIFGVVTGVIILAVGAGSILVFRRKR